MNQSLTSYCFLLIVYSDCSFNADDSFGIIWGNAPLDVTDRQPSPGQAHMLGI